MLTNSLNQIVRAQYNIFEWLLTLKPKMGCAAGPLHWYVGPWMHIVLFLNNYLGFIDSLTPILNPSCLYQAFLMFIELRASTTDSPSRPIQ